MSGTDSFLNRFDFKDEYLASRGAKAEKILKVLKRNSALINSTALLDIGCSQGHITRIIGKRFKLAVGVDRDQIVERQSGFYFVRADGCKLPLKSSMFDVVLLNHVLEHVSDQERLLNETLRVLRPGGICYLATPNRYCIIEPHYRLPFLSWLPRYLANFYVRLTGHGSCYLDYLPTQKQLRRLTQHFQVSDQTNLILSEPEFFFGSDPDFQKLTWFLRRIPFSLLKLLMPLFPVYVLILKRNRAGGPSLVSKKES